MALRISDSRIRLITLAGLGCLILISIAVLARNVTRDLNLLNSASSDNVQWTLSQSEVEFLDYKLQLITALSEPTPDLKALRREFDIFYSRIVTLRQSSIYEDLRLEPQFSAYLAEVQAFLEESASVIDQPDSNLIASLPLLLGRTVDIRPSVRQLSISGLNYFAVDSDVRRNAIAVTLTQLAIGVTLLTLILLILAIYLGRLNAQNVKRRAEAVDAGKRMNIVTDTALDAVLVSDAEGRILVFNSAAEQIFGYDADYAIGKELGELIVPDHHLEAHNVGMQRLRDGGARHVVGKGRIKLEAKRATGELFPVELAIQSAQTDDGEIFIAFLRDISHRMQAERDLVEARDRALAGEKAKTDFLATMSHEIRTPLNGLLGNLTLLQDTKLTPRQNRYVKNMETSGKLLMSHISDVLDITKYDAGKLVLRPVPMNLSDLLRDIVDNQSGAALANNTTLTWGWSGPSVDWILSDRERLQHILMNIIGNAVKFTVDGQVSIEAEVQETATGELLLQIIVSDTGIGMEPALQAQVFDDFMTGDSSYDRNVGGTGLGLGIAQRFTKALGGTITVESEKDVGSSFLLSLPIVPITPPATEAPSESQGHSAKSIDILLVEDNEINRSVAREMLQAVGHKVTEAHNGQIAVDLAKTHRFDLILMDISMPVMDGRHATREIRAEGACAKTPIVALTANAMAEEQEAFLQDGMNEVLTKPLNRSLMIDVISALAQSEERPNPVQQETATLVSQSYLSDLRETLGEAAVRKLLLRYVSEMETAIAYLMDHKLHSAEEVSQLAHRIAGSSAALGAVEMRATLVEIEKAAQTDDDETLEENIAKLPSIWDATQQQLGLE
ncbi:response regulator (plasmid) [Sulfitobacter faviae]|uniref:histidine kinase n=1 Tax=Sulfitobacter faviae TaxID=1775881 RepID=A0ABZ0V417_9RHOB|nr:response regulator [Sulfitobacter faviae]WPZ23615.1 response regulator [Sulfitobacter faviae]